MVSPPSRARMERWVILGKDVLACLVSGQRRRSRPQRLHGAHLERASLYIMVLGAVEEGRHEPVDGMPHHGEERALAPMILEKVPV